MRSSRLPRVRKTCRASAEESRRIAAHSGEAQTSAHAHTRTRAHAHTRPLRSQALACRSDRRGALTSFCLPMEHMSFSHVCSPSPASRLARAPTSAHQGPACARRAESCAVRTEAYTPAEAAPAEGGGRSVPEAGSPQSDLVSTEGTQVPISLGRKDQFVLAFRCTQRHRCGARHLDAAARAATRPSRQQQGTCRATGNDSTQNDKRAQSRLLTRFAGTRAP
eukprot:6196777-Pleurochrysis_carterae.AAC.6